MNDSGLDLGTIVVSYNTHDLLDRCLTSLRSELGRMGLRHTTYVVDNASADGSAEMVARRHPWVGLRALDTNVGFAAANNVVLREWLESPTTAPGFVLLLNPDTEIIPGALGTLLDAFDARTDVGLVGPGLVYPDGTFQPSAFRFPGLVQTALDLFPIPRLMDSGLNGRYSRAQYESGQTFDVDMTLGACMLARSNAVTEVGVLDEGFFMYCEEVDWCRRFRLAGYRIVCSPASQVVHHAGASTGQFRSAMFTALWRSRLRYFAKYEPAWRLHSLRMLVRFGLAAHGVHDRQLERRGAIDGAERSRRRSAYVSVFDDPLDP